MDMIDGATSTKTSIGRMVDMMPKATGKAVKATKKSKMAKKPKGKKCK